MVQRIGPDQPVEMVGPETGHCIGWIEPQNHWGKKWVENQENW